MKLYIEGASVARPQAVIAGTIGGASKLESNSIGDIFNVAARVEQLTKTTGDAIPLTHQTAAPTPWMPTARTAPTGDRTR